MPHTQKVSYQQEVSVYIPKCRASLLIYAAVVGNPVSVFTICVQAGVHPSSEKWFGSRCFLWLSSLLTKNIKLTTHIIITKKFGQDTVCLQQTVLYSFIRDAMQPGVSTAVQIIPGHSRLFFIFFPNFYKWKHNFEPTL